MSDPLNDLEKRPSETNPYAPPDDANVGIGVGAATKGETDDNPYAPPSADLEEGVASASQSTFYTMSTTKLMVMSTLTLGLYDLAFWWRHWRVIRDEQGDDVSVFWRTVFSPFMFFDFSRRLGASLNYADAKPPAGLGSAAALYLVCNIAGRALDRIEVQNLILDVVGIALIPLSALMVVIAQRAANELSRVEGAEQLRNTGVTAGSVIVGTLGALLWGLIIVGFTGLLPVD